LPLLFGVNNVHLMSWIEEPKFRAECFGDLTWIWCDLRSLRRYGDKHLHEKVARGYVGGVERTNKANVVLWVGGMKAELFMKLADRRLLRSLVSLYLASRKGDLPAVSAVFCPLNQQYLAVERMRVNAVATTGWAAAPQGHRWHQERGDHRNARIAAGRRIEVDRLKAWQAKRGERLRKREGECGETPRRIATSACGAGHARAPDRSSPPE
jgi:hypothetical protein